MHICTYGEDPGGTLGGPWGNLGGALGGPWAGTGGNLGGPWGDPGGTLGGSWEDPGGILDKAKQVFSIVFCNFSSFSDSDGSTDGSEDIDFSFVFHRFRTLTVPLTVLTVPKTLIFHRFS